MHTHSSRDGEVVLPSAHVGTATEVEAPRGIYMLWLVTNAGAVSNAKWVVLR